MAPKTIVLALVLLARSELAAEPPGPSRQPLGREPVPAHQAKPVPWPAESGDGTGAVQQAAHVAAATVDADAQPNAAGSAHAARPSGGAAQPLPLAPRGLRNPAAQQPAGPGPKPGGTASSIVSGAASLALVLGLFFISAWALRRALPAGPAALPPEVVEVLGRSAIGGRHHAHLLRCGNKLLLVHFSATGAETLTEIVDPVEVDRLAGLCRAAWPRSTTASFRQVFQQFAREKAPDGSGGAGLGSLVAGRGAERKP